MRGFQQPEAVAGDFDCGSIRIPAVSDNSELAVFAKQSIDGTTNGAWDGYSKSPPAAAEA